MGWNPIELLQQCLLVKNACENLQHNWNNIAPTIAHTPESTPTLAPARTLAPSLATAPTFAPTPTLAPALAPAPPTVLCFTFYVLCFMF